MKVKIKTALTFTAICHNWGKSGLIQSNLLFNHMSINHFPCCHICRRRGNVSVKAMKWVIDIINNDINITKTVNSEHKTVQAIDIPICVHPCPSPSSLSNPLLVVCKTPFLLNWVIFFTQGKFFTESAVDLASLMQELRQNG